MFLGFLVQKSDYFFVQVGGVCLLRSTDWPFMYVLGSSYLSGWLCIVSGKGSVPGISFVLPSG
jgi:hypothetical protein